MSDEKHTMEVLDQLREFIVTNFLFGDAVRAPDETTSLLESGIVDSTGVLEIVDFLEADLGISVGDDETLPENLDSLAGLTRFVLRKRASVTAPAV